MSEWMMSEVEVATALMEELNQRTQMWEQAEAEVARLNAEMHNEDYEAVLCRAEKAEAALFAEHRARIEDAVDHGGDIVTEVERRKQAEAERDKYKWQRDYVVDIAEEYGGCDFSDLDRRWEEHEGRSEEA